jgi:hypothetical protein
MNTMLHLERLLGCRVLAANNRSIGRIEEFRAERRGDGWVVVEYVIGPAGLARRLGVGATMVLGVSRPSGFVARWDQLDLTNPEKPRLLCPVAELRRL